MSRRQDPCPCEKGRKSEVLRFNVFSVGFWICLQSVTPCFPISPRIKARIHKWAFLHLCDHFRFLAQSSPGTLASLLFYSHVSPPPQRWWFSLPGMPLRPVDHFFASFAFLFRYHLHSDSLPYPSVYHFTIPPALVCNLNLPILFTSF